MDVHKHTFVPLHSKLSDKDKLQVLQRYHITIQELPKILQNDPAISMLNLKVGDVIQVERSSRTAGNVVYYRVVVKE